MNYCCAMGNCFACIARRAARREHARRQKTYGPKPAPTKQNKTVDEIVKRFS